jgi:hypothetical protein
MRFLFADLLTCRPTFGEVYLPVQVAPKLATLPSCGNRKLLYGAIGRRQKIPVYRLSSEPQSREPLLKCTGAFLPEAAL